MPLRAASPASESPASGRFRRVLGAYYGFFTIIAALAEGVIGWIMLRQLARNIQDHPHTVENVSAGALWWIANRNLVPLLALPPVICGAVLISRVSGRGAGCLLFIVATLWIIAMLAVLLFTFISYLAPMYQYQPL